MAHIAVLRRANILKNSLVFLRPQVRAMTSEYGSGEGKVCSKKPLQKTLQLFLFSIDLRQFFPAILLTRVLIL